MADPINYSGYTYDQSSYKLPTETMADYMQRLAAQRAAGVLGGGGMLDTPLTNTELGTVTQNCPDGYHWDAQANACVKNPDYRNAPGENNIQATPLTLQQKFDYMTGKEFDLGGAIASAVIPGAGMMIDSARMGDIEKSLADAGYTEKEIAAMKDNELLMGNVLYGDKKFGFEGPYNMDRPWSVEGVVEKLFGRDGDPFGITQSRNEQAVNYAQARAKDPSMFNQFVNQQMAQVVNPNYLGTSASDAAQGFSKDGKTYTASYGGTYDTSNMSNETKAGLDAIASGMFDTPSWYSEDY